MRNMKTGVAVLAAMWGVVAFGRADKYLAGGWEFAGSGVDALLEKADAFDRTALDGLILYVEAKGTDGQHLTSRNIIHQRAWTDADLAPDIPKYRQLLAHKAFRHSFLNSYRAPTNRVAWTDDATWARVANNMRVLAKFAKACGFEGLQMDPEDYHKQNQYLRVETDGMDYETLAKLARKRGAEVFRGVFEEFPDAKLLSYWFLSMGNTHIADIHPKHLRELMFRGATDLWPHFVEGILDVLPRTATLIDGLETAYSWRASKMDYYTGSRAVHDGLAQLVSPENREKYRLQMQNSFGVYLDGYSNITNGGWYMEPVNGSRLNHLRNNLVQATDAADEYLWFWSERGSWTGAKNKILAKTWESQLPGLDETLLLVKNPDVLGRRLRERMASGELKPLNGNVACVGTDPAKVPAPYDFWREHPKYHLRPGTFGCDLTQGDGDRSSLVAEGCQRGSFLIDSGDRRFKPGDVFGLSFSSKGRHLSVVIGWKKGGKWDWTIRRMFVPIGPNVTPDGWSRTDWSFAIPDGADGFGIMFNVGQDVGEKCWYDNIAVIPATAERVPGLERDKFHISCFSFHGEALNPARVRQHVREAKEAGLDFLTGGIGGMDENLNRICSEEGMDLNAIVLPRVCGGGQESASLRAKHPREKLIAQLDKFNALPGNEVVRTMNICDEPGVCSMEFLGEVARLIEEKCPHTRAYVNLFPSYAQAAESDASVKKSQLGTTSYKKYIDEYCRLVPTTFVSYDNYPIMATPEATRKFSPIWYGNLKVVADACRRTGRDLWVGPQLNSRPGHPPTSENQMRYQAFSAMAFGAVELTWACWTMGWWENFVMTTNGVLTAQYPKLKTVNAEVRALAEHYMKLRNVAAHFVGFGGLRGELVKYEIVPADRADTDGFSGICAADGSDLVVGEMMPRKEDDSIRAIFVFGADDCGDDRRKTHTVRFDAKGKIRAFGPNGRIDVGSTADGHCSFELADNSAALVVLKR